MNQAMAVSGPNLLLSYGTPSLDARLPMDYRRG